MVPCGAYYSYGRSSYNNGYRNNNNKYSNGYNNYQSAYGDDYFSWYGDTSLELQVCEDSVVEVMSMSVVCDSPYTFYYGNGANRQSPVCDYGDKAALSISFSVVDDLQQNDAEIYFTMAAYDDQGSLLASTYPEQLCTGYVGYECTKAGSYSFTYKLKFESPYGGGNSTKFVPLIQMAFSTKGDSGYNLGGVNMECEQYDEEDAAGYVSWRNSNAMMPKSGTQVFFSTYGMLLGTGFVLSAFAVYVYVRSRELEEIEYEDQRGAARKFALMGVD
jgi:hypothetical protein